MSSSRRSGQRQPGPADGAYESGGTWTNASDRNLKEGFAAVNGADLLAKLAAVPIQSWNYKSEGQSVRHLGPMAQDFFAAFALGRDDKHISTVDEGGVALAAVQQLYREGLKKDAEIRAQQERINVLQEQIRAQQAQIKAQQTETKLQEAQIRQLARQVQKVQTALKTNQRANSGVRRVKAAPPAIQQ